jgi:putative peptidoglycan lipid II flippase
MNLLKAAATVSGFTLISRLTGLVRDTLLARTFGAGDAMDAFFVAFRIPNLLRRLFAEGAFSQAFVPLLGRIKSEQGDAAAQSTIDAIALVLMWVLLAVSIVGVCGAPVLVYLLASGQSAATFDLTVLLTRVMFPYIACMSLVAMASGVLNTWRHFAVPAVTPVLLNVAMIVACVLLAPHTTPPILALAIGVMMGGVAQLAVQIPALARLGVLPRLSWQSLRWSRFTAAWRHGGTRGVLGNMAPALVGVGVAQISLLINTQIASHLGSGAVSWLSFADRLMEFPTALLGVALGTVLMPSLSKAAANRDAVQFNALLDWGLRLTCLLALPAALALVLLAQPLVAVLFHYGQFSTHDVAMTQQAVVAYALGLLGFSWVKILAPAFYAQQNVKTPVKIAVAVLVAVQAVNFLTIPWLGHAGLAMSISMGALLNAALLYVSLRRGGSAALYTPAVGWFKFALQLLLAGGAMAALLWWAAPQLNWLALQAQPWLRVGALLAVCAAGAVVYFAVLLACGLRVGAFLRRV